MLLGSFWGHSGTAYRDNGQTRDAVRELCHLAGVTALHPGKLLMRKLENSAGTVLFLTNPTEEAITELVALPQSSCIETLLGEEFSLCGDSIRITVQPLDVVAVLCKAP